MLRISAVLFASAIALAACGPRGSEEPAQTAANPVVGTPGSDQLSSTSGADAFDGGDGFDYARYDYAPAAVTVDLVDPSQNTGEATGDTYVSIEGIAGTAFDDVISGTDDTNDLHGGTGGNDRISGRGGDDGLTGDAGDDTLDGGAGADTYVGGAGADTYIFRTGEADGDRINGFEAGDTIVLTGYGPGATFTRAGGSRWQVRSADGAVTETITISGETPAATAYRFE